MLIQNFFFLYRSRKAEKNLDLKTYGFRMAEKVQENEMFLQRSWDRKLEKTRMRYLFQCHKQIFWSTE